MCLSIVRKKLQICVQKWIIFFLLTEAATMGEKREVPKPLKKLLDWDVVMTDKFVKYVDMKYGPLSKHKSTLKGLEVCARPA